MVQCSTEYDLAILGGSTGSRLAAMRAAQMGARVALIAPCWQLNDAVEASFRAIAQPGLERSHPWAHGRALFEVECRHRPLSPAQLRACGVDVVLAGASFSQTKSLKVEQRHIQASRYLLADGYSFSPSPSGALLCHQLMQLDVLPENITLVGGGAAAVEWAFGLSRFAKVTLLSPQPRLLPAEDGDIERLMAAQLRSLGVAIAALDGDFTYAAEQMATMAETGQVVLVPQYQVDASLGMAQLGIEAGDLSVNAYLQVRQWPQLYAVGACLGGVNRAALAQQEMAIALDNALFNARRPMGYERVFYGIHGLSPVGRWGLTEQQAHHRYGARAVVFKSSCLPVAEHGGDTNFCKLITLGKTLIGIHLMGRGAMDLVSVLARCETMPTLAPWAAGQYRSGTLYQAIYQAIAQWENQRWQPGQWRRDWAENWFNWRRSQGN
ncbi:FAD-dependent oxidoreductase [Leptothoe kymatousa]|uniref:NAD(P)/FAD-dependent oxidoreductase n=1 Tax=Leptothoe kymatousa TAU-MAC 1615 TaxID=2364775 RepID=A0ABS5Y077_9CYAN|nr:FAD-dependent oxidoreductase [Leptothoe kymatousa]MBT9311240.1 NAD(P)/FAD-dependent oxidoreductase [Leptothoe kymatousa TAU-MAC 1615]